MVKRNTQDESFMFSSYTRPIQLFDDHSTLLLPAAITTASLEPALTFSSSLCKVNPLMSVNMQLPCFGIAEVLPSFRLQYHASSFEFETPDETHLQFTVLLRASPRRRHVVIYASSKYISITTALHPRLLTVIAVYNTTFCYFA